RVHPTCSGHAHAALRVAGSLYGENLGGQCPRVLWDVMGGKVGAARRAARVGVNGGSPLRTLHRNQSMADYKSAPCPLYSLGVFSGSAITRFSISPSLSMAIFTIYP